MSKPTQYRVVRRLGKDSQHASDELTASVEGWMASGWVPLGGPTFVYEQNGFGTLDGSKWTAFQAMTKD